MIRGVYATSEREVYEFAMVHAAYSYLSPKLKGRKRR